MLDKAKNAYLTDVGSIGVNSNYNLWMYQPLPLQLVWQIRKTHFYCKNVFPRNILT